MTEKTNPSRTKATGVDLRGLTKYGFENMNGLALSKHGARPDELL